MMKKITVLLMLLFSMSVFGAKFKTDRKDNFDKLAGRWEMIGTIVIKKEKTGWYYTIYRGAESVVKPEKKKMISRRNGTFTFEGEKFEGYAYGYDTRLKALVLTYNGEIIERAYRLKK